MPTHNSNVPNYDIYGEIESWSLLELMHCEPLRERSQQHNWKISPHQHTGMMQVFFIESGGAVAYLDEEVQELIAPCWLIIPEKCIHGFEWRPGSAGYVLSISSPLLKQVTHKLEQHRDILENAKSYPIHNDIPRIKMLFASITTEYQNHYFNRELVIESQLTTLLSLVCRHAYGQNIAQATISRSQKHFARFQELMEAHLRDRLTIAEYAKKVGLSAPHLNVVCHEMDNCSALEVLHKRILTEAKRLLIYNGASVTQISFELGFKDPAHFSKFFKKHTDTSPTVFREKFTVNC